MTALAPVIHADGSDTGTRRLIRFDVPDPAR